MYAKWIQSWRDLPDPDQPVGERRPLGEGDAAVPAHDRVPLAGRAHRARDRGRGAGRDAARSSALYKEFAENELAMPVIDGQKSESEKFAGASRTYSIEALMGDGRALQAGTSHNLGQNFAKAFEIQFQGRDKTRAARLDDVVGRVDAADRRRDHDARRRQRPDPAAARRAVSGGDRADPARQLAGDGAAEGAGDSRRAACGTACA